MTEAGDLDQLRTIAAEAVRVGGRVIEEAGSPSEKAEKGAGDYVTRVDRASEEAIGDFLAMRTPDIPIVGEEYGGVAADAYWLVDPLDGTTNFLHGFPVVGVSVAFIEDGEPTAGAVHCPALDTTYTGARGRGADQDGRALSVTTAKPAEAIVATGHPFRHKERLPEYLTVFEAALERFEDLRRPGAATLDLSWVAAGVFDGFFELGLASWDVAAGGLLIEEAGGVVTDWTGGPDYLAGDILAGPPAIHEALLEIVRASE
jgi:myo-inositol-1(or 4)-monophosphatase